MVSLDVHYVYCVDRFIVIHSCLDDHHYWYVYLFDLKLL